MANVVVHIGLPKTGTTSIQAALDASVDDLAGVGVLVPGGGHAAHRRAAYDLVGQRIGGGEGVAGAFESMVEEIRRYDGDRVVVSEEELGRARPRHVRRLVRSLEGHDVHVVVGVRDLARTLTSGWQQSVVMGATTTWSEFARAARDPGDGPVRAGASFRLRHDLLRVLDVWERHVPRDRIRLVTVPPRGSSPAYLLERFAAATGIPATAWPHDVEVRNDALGAVQTEVLRQLNVALDGRLPLAQYRLVVEHGLRPGWRAAPGRPLRLPVEESAWVVDRSWSLVEELRRRGYAVHGTLQDLVPTQDCMTPVRPDDATDTELRSAAQQALVSLALAHGRLHRRHRRAAGRDAEPNGALADRLASAGRAGLFASQRRLLDDADRHRVLAAAVRPFLRRR